MVHELLSPEPLDESQTLFIGVVTLSSPEAQGLQVPEQYEIPSATASTNLKLELAYMFLPISWGKGYATESVLAVFSACARAEMFWTPYGKVYVRVIVNEENVASQRVMAKIPGMLNKGVYVWRGEPLFITGKWITESPIMIFGMYLLE